MGGRDPPRHVLRARGGSAERPDGLLRRGRAGVPLGRPSRGDVALVHEGLVPGRGGASGLAHEAAAPRPRGRGRRRRPRQRPGREVHDRAAGGREGRSTSSPGDSAARCPRGARRRARCRGRGRSRGRSRSEHGKPSARRWRSRSPTPSCAGSTSAPRGPPAALDLDAVSRVMCAELGWGEARIARERAALQLPLPGRQRPPAGLTPTLLSPAC